MKKINIQVLWCMWALLLLLSGNAIAQKHDYNWVMGMHEFPGAPGYNNALLHFSPNGIQVEQLDLKMNFEATATAMSDSAGQLLFYTNGCEIANALGETMQGGIGLNPGEIHEWVCNQTGYISPRGAMAIPVPGSNHVYYLFHMGLRYDPYRKTTLGPFYFTEIDMGVNGGKGAVTSKNNLLTDGDLEPFTAVRHGNGRDWWLVIPVYGGQEYRLFLVTPVGIEGPFLQNIGSLMNCRHLGTNVFSLDGQKFARAQNCKVAVMDFDRCTGRFSSPQVLDLPIGVIGGGGVAFSPDNQRLLVSAQLQILEADLATSSPILDSAFVWNYQWGVSLQHMQYTPFGQIAMNHMHRAQYLSLIGKPSLSSDSMGFEPKGISLPIYSVRTLPNYPNYRLYDVPGSPCDSLGINTPVVNTTTPMLPKEGPLQIFPNPGSETVQFQRPSDATGELCLMDQTGKIMLTKAVFSAATVLDLTEFPAGIYWAMVKERDGVRVGKIVIVQAPRD
ncbi:MAG: T9SS type A sorting domain-containing protein [Saprospiraceae bacterium]